jgi:subtilisin-like proprotein convertase family protein
MGFFKNGGERQIRSRAFFGVLLALSSLAIGVPCARATTFSFTSSGSSTFAGASSDRRSSPYPWSVTASGMPTAGPVTAVRVKLNGLTHPRPDDIEILLVSPSGAKLVIMADAGGVSGSVSPINVVFDDAAVAIIPDAGPLTAGTFKPTCVDAQNNIQTEFPSPAPASPYQAAQPRGTATLTSVFGGTANPNGTWSLYIVDDVSSDDGGANVTSWTLEVDVTASAQATTTTLVSSINPSITNQSVTFTATARKQSDNSAVTSGTVTFHEGATTLAGSVPVNGSGQASFNTSALTEGDHTITADYNAASGFIASTTNLSQRVDATTIQNGNTFRNLSGITLLSVAPGTATVFPSHINVSGLAGTISKVSLTLSNITIDRLDDLEVLLVAPNGAHFIPLNDAGGVAAGVNNITLVLDDSAGSAVPDSTAPGSGTFLPSGYGTSAFPSPAPAGPYNYASPEGGSTFANIFNGLAPNGTWSLYVQDDVAGGGGTISGGWGLTFNTTSDQPTATTASSSANPSLLGSNVTFTATVENSANHSAVTTGTVTFREGTAVLAGPVTLNGSGQASFSTTALTEGSHTMAASYNGAPGQFNTSLGDVTQRVDRVTEIIGNVFRNSGQIVVQQTGALTADVYPSRIMVTNAGASLTKISVTISNLAMPDPDDLELLLVGPQGQSFVLISDSGGTATPASSVTLVFSDDAASAIPDNGPLASGTFKPTSQNVTAANFPSPAPAPPYIQPAPFGTGTLTSAFGGTNPNGYWSLYVMDDVTRSTSTAISSGWSIALQSTPMISCPADITVSNAPGQCSSAPVAFSETFGGEPASVVISKLGATVITSPYVFPVGTNVVVSTATNSVGTNSCSFTVIVVNTEPPVAGSDTIGAAENTPVDVPLSTLLANDTTSKGGSLNIVGVSATSVHGGAVTLGGASIMYSPPAGYIGADQFTYTLSDGCGSAPGTVNASIVTSNSPPFNVISITATSTDRTVQFAGIPYHKYVVQWATNVIGPWTDFADGTLTVDSTGTIQYTDSTLPTPDVRFYRMRVGP